MTDVWLVGSGQMACDYVKVLSSLNIEFNIIGRGDKSASALEKLFNLSVQRGGLEDYAKKAKIPKNAIISVGVEQLLPVSLVAINSGIKRILVEKPAGLSLSQITTLSNHAKDKNVEVFVAYNRRYYESVIQARKIIKSDGGVKSFYFDFTELGDQIQELKIEDDVKKSWLLANSSHVIDLAFHLSGKPCKLDNIIKGGNSWHPSGSIYAGCGETSTGAIFSYHANWDSAGRWGLEVVTQKRRLIFRPIEKLQIMLKGSFSHDFYNLNEKLDTQFKPGLYRQIQAFFYHNESQYLCTLKEHKNNSKIYSLIAGYN